MEQDTTYPAKHKSYIKKYPKKVFGRRRPLVRINFIIRHDFVNFDSDCLSKTETNFGLLGSRACITSIASPPIVDFPIAPQQLLHHCHYCDGSDEADGGDEADGDDEADRGDEADGGNEADGVTRQTGARLPDA